MVTSDAVSPTTLDVPSSSDAIFLIVGENTSGFAEYSGIFSLVNFETGQKQNAAVSMSHNDEKLQLSFPDIYWPDIGVSKYTIMYASSSGGTYCSLGYDGSNSSANFVLV